eukprot:5307060-Prymnesium_polylepis.1
MREDARSANDMRGCPPSLLPCELPESALSRAELRGGVLGGLSSSWNVTRSRTIRSNAPHMLSRGCVGETADGSGSRKDVAGRAQLLGGVDGAACAGGGCFFMQLIPFATSAAV